MDYRMADCARRPTSTSGKIYLHFTRILTLLKTTKALILVNFIKEIEKPNWSLPDVAH